MGGSLAWTERRGKRQRRETEKRDREERQRREIEKRDREEGDFRFVSRSFFCL